MLTANPDALTLTAGVTTTISVLGNDFNNGQPASTTNVTVTVATPPATGTATVNANGTIGFIPAAGFTGPVSFTYTICDIAQTTVCSSAIVSLTVNPVPAVLTANPDALTLTAGVTTSISVLGNDFNNGQPASTTNVTVTLCHPTGNGHGYGECQRHHRIHPRSGFHRARLLHLHHLRYRPDNGLYLGHRQFDGTGNPKSIG